MRLAGGIKESATGVLGIDVGRSHTFGLGCRGFSSHLSSHQLED
jgi:hypothetical protein